MKLYSLLDKDADFNKAPQGWKALAVALASISILVLINVVIIFKEGWVLPGFPHEYLYTALQKYHGNVPVTNFSPQIDNVLYSPLYQLSTLFAHLGEPSPPWFRLAGVVLLVLIFIVSYFLWPSPTSSTDRLLVAMTVATTPAVFFVTRYLEDHGLHMLILLIGTATLLHSHMGRTTFKAMPFYILPALDLFLTHTITNFIITMMSFAGIYIYSIFARAKVTRVTSIMKSEIPRLTLAAIAWAVADKIRFPAGLLSTFSYYRGEVEDFHAPHVSWITHVLVYPEVLLFSAAGVILCSLALLNISWRLRGSNVWMFLLWILIPLIVLTPIIKKNNYYVWTLAPAISLLAASVLSKFSLNLKKVWIIICFVFASFHMLHFASPLEGLVNPILFQENFSIKALSFPPSSKQQDMEVAHEVLKLAEKCGPLENRPLSFMQPPVLVPLNFYFCMLYLDRRPVYWFPVNVFIKTENATIVEMIEDKKRYSAKMWQEWENRLGSDYNELQKTHVVVYESSKYRVYCPKGSIEKQKAIEP